MKVYAQQGDTIDEICFRYYGRTQQVVEQVYAANAGLAEHGQVLPHGCEVVLSELSASPTSETIKLWD